MKPLHMADFYKVGHPPQYPDGTEVVFANWTARKSRLVGVDKVILFGLQAYNIKILIREWNEGFFNQSRKDVIGKYRRRLQNAGITITYDHIEALHNLGYMPLTIWALPEGTAVPIGVPMFVMWNTMPEFFWLTNYVETSMSSNIWGPCTSATIAKEYRTILDKYAKMTGGDMGFVDYQAHDFSYRGMYGDYAAALSGGGHLTSFKGTDSIPAIDWLEEYDEGTDIGGSIPANEHSVMCMGGKDNEVGTVRRLINELYPTGPISGVVDTWDYFKFLTEGLPKLKDDIMARDGMFVVRPDSGDPADIICGNPDATPGTPEFKGTWEILWDIFGGTVNDKNYKVLDPHIGAIYGDSITLVRAANMCMRLERKGFVPRMVLGVGSYTYQMVTRDTFGFALKSTAGVVNGELREIFKDPVTDDGTKKSAKGLIAVDENLKMRQVKTFNEVKDCAFVNVFHNGSVPNKYNLTDIRERIKGAN